MNNLHLLNRLAVSSMCSYAAGPGNQIANLHLSRYKSFSAQHPGLIMIEGMCVDPKGNWMTRNWVFGMMNKRKS